jgi:MerR family transcriptional regulator, heat shock protein HspR
VVNWGIYAKRGPTAEVHPVVVAAIDADRRAAEDVPIYRIQTVSALTGIPARRLRNWEDEHKLLSPARTKGRHRLYSTREVNLIRQIKRLVEDEGLSLKAVKAWREANQVEPARLG